MTKPKLENRVSKLEAEAEKRSERRRRPDFSEFSNDELWEYREFIKRMDQGDDEFTDDELERLEFFRSKLKWLDDPDGTR